MQGNKKIKILYLAKILLEKTDDTHGLTIAEMSDALKAYGISSERKTFYDDIEVLRTFGIDIESRKEGARVVYGVASRIFETPELKLLVDAVQSSKFITHKKSEALIRKLETFASVHQARALHRQVHVQGRIKTMNESIYYTVDDIHAAISEDRKIAFCYYQWNEKKEKVFTHGGKPYTVSPFALTWDDENYYMIAYDSDACIIKHFRVDKMVRISVLDEKRDGKEHFKSFDMAIFSKRTFGMFGGKEERVVLHCKNALAGVMIDRFGTETVMIPCADGCFEAHVSVSVSPTFFAWLCTFGADVTVTSPQSVRQAYADHVRGILSQYDS